METYALEINDLVLEVPNQNKSGAKYVRLLNGITTRFESGKVSVIMGASGSSKTTMMSAIAGRIDQGSRTYGEILFKGKPRNPNTWLKTLAYLEQDDCIVPQQSVEEYINFSVGCRMSEGELAGKNVNGIVENVMKQLHIDKLKDMKLSAVSGGERKRVMIAVELAVGADILLLDEATSGLDSHLALNLVDMVKKYAVENNKIVIMIVHQPGSGLFEMFDHFLFLNRGSVVYSGPIGECDEFLSSRGIVRDNNLSKSEFWFELFSSDSVVKEIKEHREAIEKMAADADREARDRVEGKPLKTGNDTKFDFSVSFYHIRKIFMRQLVHDWRTWGILKRWIFDIVILFTFLRMGVSISIISIISSAGDKFKLDLSNPKTFYEYFEHVKQNYNSELFPDLMTCVSWGCYPFLLFLSCIGTSTLLDDISYIHRETIKGTYSIITLYSALFMSELFHSLIRCMSFFSILRICCGVECGYTPRLLIFVIGGATIAMLTNLLIKCVTSARIFRMVATTLNSMLVIIARPRFLSGLVQIFEKNEYFKKCLYLKHPVLAIWPHVSYESLMQLGLINNVISPEGSTRDLENEVNPMMLSLYFQFSPEVLSVETAKRFTSYYVIGDSESISPEVLHSILFGVKTLFIVLLGICLLVNRFSPSLRLKLKKE